MFLLVCFSYENLWKGFTLPLFHSSSHPVKKDKQLYVIPVEDDIAGSFHNYIIKSNLHKTVFSAVDQFWNIDFSNSDFSNQSVD